MAAARVRIVLPPGSRACGQHGPNLWVYARASSGATPFFADLEFLKSRFPSGESRAQFMVQMHELMTYAASGELPWDMVRQMQCAPDVLEIKLPDWWFSGGKMHVRLYFSEPWATPGTLVALRVKTKRPGPIGLDEQDAVAMEASDLLLEWQDRGFD